MQEYLRTVLMVGWYVNPITRNIVGGNHFSLVDFRKSVISQSTPQISYGFIVIFLLHLPFTLTALRSLFPLISFLQCLLLFPADLQVLFQVFSPAYICVTFWAFYVLGLGQNIALNILHLCLHELVSDRLLQYREGFVYQFFDTCQVFKLSTDE